RITRGDRPAVAVDGQVFRWIKAERRVLGEAAGSLAFPFGAVRLRAVFDDPQSMVGGELLHRVDIRRAAVQMHRENPNSLLSDLLARIFRIDRVGVIDIAEDRLGADVNHRLDAWKRGE